MGSELNPCAKACPNFRKATRNNETVVCLRLILYVCSSKPSYNIMMSIMASDNWFTHFISLLQFIIIKILLAAVQQRICHLILILWYYSTVLVACWSDIKDYMLTKWHFDLAAKAFKTIQYYNWSKPFVNLYHYFYIENVSLFYTGKDISIFHLYIFWQELPIVKKRQTY